MQEHNATESGRFDGRGNAYKSELETRICDNDGQSLVTAKEDFVRRQLN